jgi:hypothetical protein
VRLKNGLLQKGLIEQAQGGDGGLMKVFCFDYNFKKKATYQALFDELHTLE